MPYKTISIKLKKPTAKKKRMLDDAINRYTGALEAILRALREQSAGPRAGEGVLPAQPGKETLALADGFRAKPFKDALKMDAAAVLKTYARACGAGRSTAYPVVRTCDADIEAYLSGFERMGRHAADKLFDKYHSLRPLLFCRYDVKRDYALLRDEKTGRCYAKLYLFELGDAIAAGAVKRTLRYIKPGGAGGLLEKPRKKQRYILVPLVTGPWEQKHLSQISQGEAVPKSAALLKKKNGYFLNIRLWYAAPEKLSCDSYMGVCRAAGSELCYAVTDARGELIEEGAVHTDGVNGKNRLHSLSNEVLRVALKHKSRIVMAGLSRRSDQLRQENTSPRLSAMDYHAVFSLLSYKTEFSGLEKPMQVSASTIFYRCPDCGAVRKANRWKDTFLCVQCGFSKQLELTGAHNLACTPARYQKNKIRVDCRVREDGVAFSCRLLGLSCTCPNDENARGFFFGVLRAYLSEAAQDKNDAKNTLACRLLRDPEPEKRFYFQTERDLI